MKMATVLVAGLFLVGCSSAPTDSAKEGSAASSQTLAAEATESTRMTPEAVVESLKNQGLCNGIVEVPETDENPNPGTVCVGLQNSEYQVAVVGQAGSEADAKAFAEEAFRTVAGMRIKASDMNNVDWLYEPEGLLVMAADKDIVPAGSYTIIYSPDEVVQPAVGSQLSRLKYDTRQWHGRCGGDLGAAINLYDEPSEGELYDQCATGSPLTEINTFSGWWQMSPYLEEQKDLIQAPASGPFYAIIGDYWSVVDTVANKKEMAKLQKEIGGEIIDLTTFDPEKFELDIKTLK